MLTGKPDAGNLHVRFDEGEWQDWHVYVAGCRSLLYCPLAQRVVKKIMSGVAHVVNICQSDLCLFILGRTIF